MNKPSKVVLKQYSSAGAEQYVYIVQSLTNRVQPRTGEQLTQSQVERLIADPKTTVEIKPA